MSPSSPDAAFEQAVAELLEHINMGRTHDELFGGIYDRFRDLVPYDRIAVALLDESGDNLRLTSCRSDREPVLKVGFSDPVAGSTLQTLLQTGQPRIINDLADYLRKKPGSRSTRLIVREGMRSNLTLPLLAEGRPTGVIFFSSRKAGVYHDGHIRLLHRVAGHIAVAVEKAQLLAALRERNEELTEANRIKDRFLQELQAEVTRQTADLRASEQRYHLLADLGRLITSSLDVRQVFRRTAKEVRRLLDCDRVSLVLMEPEQGTRRGFAVEFRQGETSELDIPAQSLTDSAAEWVLSHRQARIARRLDRARPFAEDRKLHAQGYRAYIYLPLVCRDRVAGLWGVATRRDAAVDGWDLGLLHELSSILASALDNATAYEQVARLRARLEQENVYLRGEVDPGRALGDLVGTGPAMRRLCRSVEQVAPTDSTVLILGETGTGKELIARAIHEQSPRREQLLVKVNCAALSPGVLASELFGHEAGAFTGAARARPGRFEVAHRGTIFLDEIAEVPPETQVLLLRVLQERVIERVGSNEPVPVNVRVIAATNRDLRAGVAEGWFRADLFYRLHVFPLHVPSLRERPEDIPALVDHFVSRLARKLNRQVHQVSRQTLDLLCAYAWPGNVRELENLVERALIVSTGDTLEVDPTWLTPAAAHSAPLTAGETVPLADVERRTILDALERCGGKIYGPGGAARLLGLRPTTLYGKMRKYGIARKNPSGFA
jgi:formate hydrogenlyase transcriptional activator